MFYGRFEHTIDEKGRLTIPAKFREALIPGLTVTRGLDQCLYVFPKDDWDRFAAKLKQLPLTNTSARSLTRFFLSYADDSKPDKQGRVLIPNYLREFAKLGDRVIVGGQGDRLEVWNIEAWETQRAKLEQDPEGLAAQLTDLGIL